MSMMPTQSLIGIWRSCAFPTQETVVVFCLDGKGFLFFYWGSIGAPILDEFDWSLKRNGELDIAWAVCHDHAEDGSLDLEVTSGKTEAITYEILWDPVRALRIDLGMHAGFDTPLEYVGGAEDSSHERGRWQQFTKGFDPFGPGRQVWTVDDKNRWHPLHCQLAEEPVVRPPFSQWQLLGLILGTFGQVAYMADYGREILPVWLRIGFHLLPILPFVLFSEDDFRSGLWVQFVRRAHRAGAIGFLLVTGVALTFTLVGLVPSGWALFAAFIGFGCAVSVRTLRELGQCTATFSGEG
jgi:hypothetical protein